jgi:hypothetical protein
MLVLAAALERLQFRLRAEEARRWWASNGRDVINAAALLGVSASLKLLGYSGPMSLCAGGAVMLGLSLVQAAAEKHRHAGWWSAGAALLFGAPLLLFPAEVHGILRAGLEALF